MTGVAGVDGGVVAIVTTMDSSPADVRVAVTCLGLSGNGFAQPILRAIGPVYVEETLVPVEAE